MSDYQYSLVEAAGGLGLYLFSMRTLTRVLQRSFSRRLRGALASTFAHPWQCLAGGFLYTALVQASSIGVLGAMSMVGSTLISLEQGYFMVLGCTLGTTMKTWILSLNALKFGPILVALASVALLFSRSNSVREVFEAILAIGSALWGMWLISHGLEPLLELQFLHNLLADNSGINLAQQSTGVLVGTLLAACVQSSSTVVALMIGLSAKGLLPLPLAAAMILGANIGTTLGPLLASVEHGPNMRRLALAHVITKILGVGITLFFFPQFVNVMSYLAWQLFPSNDSAIYTEHCLASVHTGFNLINVLWWSAFSGPMLRAVTWIVPNQQEGAITALPPLVRRMLSRSPQRSLEEAQRQMTQLQTRLKTLLDHTTALLTAEQEQLTRTELRLWQQKEFGGLKDSVFDLLIQASSNPSLVAHQHLGALADFDQLHHTTVRFRDLLEQGLLREGYELHPQMTRLLPRYQQCLDELWLAIVFPDRKTVAQINPSQLANEFEESFLTIIREEPELSPLAANWLFDVTSQIRALLHTLAQFGGCPLPNQGQQTVTDPLAVVAVTGQPLTQESLLPQQTENQEHQHPQDSQPSPGGVEHQRH